MRRLWGMLSAAERCRLLCGRRLVAVSATVALNTAQVWPILRRQFAILILELIRERICNMASTRGKACKGVDLCRYNAYSAKL